MSKIKKFEQARISIDGGYGEISISEESDNTFNIEITETVDNKLRVGIRDEHGITYMYWKKIQQLMRDYERGKLKFFEIIPKEEELGNSEKKSNI